VGDDFAAFDSGDWTAEEQAALSRAALTEWEQALAEAGGDRQAAARLWVENRLERRHIPGWHPERNEYVDGIPRWHPEREEGDDGPPEGGVRDPRRPSPSPPSDTTPLEEPTSE
jgi:hypothetical protein